MPLPVPRIEAFALPDKVERATEDPTPMNLYDTPLYTKFLTLIAFVCKKGMETAIKMPIKTPHEHLSLPCSDFI